MAASFYREGDALKKKHTASQSEDFNAFAADFFLLLYHSSVRGRELLPSKFNADVWGTFCWKI